MLTQGFYYFLLIGEIAILGLLMTGIVYKVKTIINLYSDQSDDQNYEHFVSGSDQRAQAKSDIYHDLSNRIGTGGIKIRTYSLDFTLSDNQTFFRKRMDWGVTSTSSSSLI